MSNKMNLDDKIVSCVFILLLVTGLLFSVDHGFGINKAELKNIIGNGSEAIGEFEKSYNREFSSYKYSSDAFSIIQKVLMKHEVRGFEVIRSNDNFLYFPDNSLPDDEESLDTIADQIEIIRDVTEEKGGKFLFVQMPYKNPDKISELKFYSNDSTEKSEDLLLDHLAKEGVKVFDLRKIDDQSQVYKTDHHWRVESAFASAGSISEFIKESFGVELGGIERYEDVNNYSILNYSNSFLGSMGIKIGRFYVGKDDFAIFVPDFDTNIEFSHYTDNELDFHKKGEWDILFDRGILENEEYNNKYNSLLYGLDHECVINNAKSDNDKRVLLISHSYGRPLAMYMSLYYREVTFLDPQKGRYDGSLVKYIDHHEPDVVIVAYNDFLNIDN